MFLKIRNSRLDQKMFFLLHPDLSSCNTRILRAAGHHRSLQHHWELSTLGSSQTFQTAVSTRIGLLLPLPSHVSRVQLCATPQTAAHQAPPPLGFSRQEHWSGLPLPSPMHESEKWKWSRSVVSDSLRPHGLQPTRLLHPWDFPGKSTGVGCHCLLRFM